MRGVITPIETVRRRRGDEATRREAEAGRRAAVLCQGHKIDPA